MGSIPPSGTGRFFLPFFSSFAFLTLTALSIYLGVCASVGRVLSVYLAGLHTTINIPVVVYLAYGSTANFLF